MNAEPELRQRLLELVYGLLADDEAAELRLRIEADPQVAQAFADAQEEAGLFGEAARLAKPRVQLKRPEQTATGAAGPLPASAAPASPPSAAEPPRPKAGVRIESAASSGRWAAWAVTAAAGVLLLFALSGYFFHRHHLAAVTAEHLRLIVNGPSVLQSGMDNEFVVTTTTVHGVPLPSQVEVALFAPDKKRLLKQKEETDENGQIRVIVPADMTLPEYAELAVTAVSGGKEEKADAPLGVERFRRVTHLSMDRPLYQPGDAVFYRSLTLNRFGLAADQEATVQFEVLDPSGAAVAGSQREGRTVRGVGCGEFALSEGSAGGEYTLAARSPEGLFPEEKKTFFVRRYRKPRLKKDLEFARDSYGPGDTVVADFSARRAEGGPAAKAQLSVAAEVDGQPVHERKAAASESGALRVEFKLPEKIERGDGLLRIAVDDGGTLETVVKTIPINLGRLDVRFYPEGGDLVAGLENRVYFAARDPQGKPVHVKGTVYNSRNQEVGEIETFHEGMGSFSFQPLADQRYRLKISSPPDVKNEPELPKPVTSQKVVLTTGIGVFEAGKPLEFNVRAVKSGMPLVAAAYCRGVPVGQQWFTTVAGKDGEPGANPVRIDLPPEAGGVLRLTVYDYSASPPTPLAERLVYRQPERRLKVQVAGHSEQYAPGESASLSLVVTDEAGQPVPATLGVAVVDDSVLSLADDKQPGMACHLLLTSELEKPEDLEKADFYLSNDPKAPVALDLLLGTQGWRRFVERTLEELKKENKQDEQIDRLVAMEGKARPPLMSDNLDRIQTKYKDALAAFQGDRASELNALTIVSFFGGAALLLFATLLTVMNVAAGLRVWAPAVGAAAVCLVMGFVLTNPAALKPGIHGAVAFASFDAPPAVAPKQTEATVFLADVGTGPVEEAKAAAPADEPAGMPGLPADPRQLGRVLLFRGDKNGGLEAGRDLKEIRGKLKADRGEFADQEKAMQLGADRPQAARPAGEIEELEAQQQRFVVREHAHKRARPKDAPPGVRTDFAETLYWHPMLVADQDGKAQVRFDLPDSVTTFRVMADAHAGGGRIGSGQGELISRIPFNLQPKLPLEVTAGDRIDLPVAVVNDTQRELPVELSIEHDDLVRLDGGASQQIKLAAQQRARQYFALEVVGQKGQGKVVVRGSAGALADEVGHALRIVPPGFPISRSFSGQLAGTQELTIDLPQDWVPGSLEVAVNVFPSMMADLQKGMDGLLREPNGCFEQASTSNYPNVMSLQYMEENNLADPEVTRRAKDLLKSGYTKLTGYECPTKGYEWFGGDPGHEALTAYGLLQFRDMAKVYEVDPAMIDRTAKWILERRDGKGGFQRNPKALDSFGGAPQEVTDAYVTWALTESGQKDVEAEVKHAIEIGQKSEDPYAVALAAASAANYGKKDDAKKLLDKLAKTQAADGHVQGVKDSITRSGGVSLDVEATALAALAWLKLPEYSAQANRAIEWITKSRQGDGAFGSTQATILALKALVEHARANKRTLNAGKLIVKRDNALVGEQGFEAGRRETIRVEGIETKLHSGENKLSIELTGENKLPYALDVSYRSRKPAADRDCPIRLTTSLARNKVAAGETVALKAELENATGQGQPMSVAILGLPAGLEVRPDQLKDLKKAGTIDYFELNAREVVCYWRSLAPKRKVEIKLDLVAAVPGRYTGPASRAYLYYTAERKCWVDPLAVEVTRQ